MVINKRHSDVHEGESSQSSFTYEDEARFFQSTTTQLDLQNSIPQGDESSSIQRPGLPRLWSGMSEPADLYSASGEPYNVANPSQLDWIHQEPPGKPVTGAPLERSISSLQNLQASSLQQSSSNISSAATDHISKNASMASDPRQTYSYPASVAPSTPKSVSSRGRSRGTTHSHISSREFRIPDLKFSFFESDFYRRFHIQSMCFEEPSENWRGRYKPYHSSDSIGPLIDPIDFMNRYKAACPYSADSMGPAGAILCHVMYAWACSYGIDESGQMLVTSNEWHIPENTMHPDRQQQYSIRESARQRQLEQTNLAVKQVLKEIDQAGILRNITWDGVRCLLLILPLTEYVSSAAERLAMYECALGQVFSLCSASALGYDGLPAMPSPEQELVRRRLYWYAFVHEGITTGLKGGRMVLDEDELSSLDDVLPQAARSVSVLSEKELWLGHLLLVHKALTGAKARRRERVDRKLLNDAWEALEESWIEFDNMKTFSPGPLSRPDDVIKFADGWVSYGINLQERLSAHFESDIQKIFMFEAHNVIRESLEHRANILANDRDSARLMDLGMAETQGNSHDQILSEIQHLRSIARAKCDYVLREIASIVKQHINTTFFEWDASLVRGTWSCHSHLLLLPFTSSFGTDGTYYAAILLAETNGSDNDITACLEALSEMRWAFARTQERSQGNAESDLLALAMEDDRPMMQGDQMLQAQFQQSPFQQQPFVANSTSTNSTLAIPQTVDHAREHGDKLTGWSGQHVQYVANPRGTAYPYGWQP
ncbi:hypothetical protein QFC19_006839 [Naganishia cerealis]|uniref:Uncharacterized protein n=1 Tax=Naganishia cerealis TaxID=610337 RepID=A0ACC2VE40_9TREE|nr:hypothetical protein QFC19_006839 [Naganishia cerealis]